MRGCQRCKHGAMHCTVLTNVQRRKIQTEDLHPADQIVDHGNEQPVVLIEHRMPYLMECLEDFIPREFRAKPRYENIVVQLFLKLLQRRFHPFESEATTESADIHIVALDDASPEGIRHFHGRFRSHERIAITVSTGPESHLDDRIAGRHGISELRLHEADDPARRMIKYIFQIPYQADRFIVWRRLPLFKKWRLTQLLQIAVDLPDIVLRHGTRKIVDDPQYRAWIKLSWMRRQYKPHGKIPELRLQLHLGFRLSHFVLQMLQRSGARHIVDIPEGGILERIE